MKNGGNLRNSHRFLSEIGNLEPVYVVFQQINPRFGDCEVIFLRYMDISMAHLSAKEMLGRVQLCHHGSVGVAEVMIFEIYPHAF